jgi:hypothetical protein
MLAGCSLYFWLSMACTYFVPSKDKLPIVIDTLISAESQ